MSALMIESADLFLNDWPHNNSTDMLELSRRLNENLTAEELAVLSGSLQAYATQNWADHGYPNLNVDSKTDPMVRIDGLRKFQEQLADVGAIVLPADVAGAAGLILSGAAFVPALAGPAAIAGLVLTGL